MVRMLHVPRVLFFITLFLLLLSPPAVSANNACNRTNNTLDKLLSCVTLEGVRAHQAAFQAIADDNADPYYPGTRAAGTEGYANSAAYVAGLLQQAGLNVTLDPFEFQFDFPALLHQLTPVNAQYASGAFTGSGFGDVTGSVIPVDLALLNPAASSSGCDASDFAGLDFSGLADIALIQRGTCTFAIKALNAQAAGAEAVVIFNQGSDPTRMGLIVGTLAPSSATIPVVGGSFADGVALSAAGSTARVRVLESETRTDYNVIAELPGRNNDNVVMVGAHLDSVTEGPGINDNGSGSAAILEVALQMSKVKPWNTVRFAWWGAEEGGLIGSEAYVAELSEEELDRITLYLNFDMIGSPNFFRGVYDGDDSDGVGAGAGPDGSAQIEDVFEQYYMERGLAYQGTDFSGRSDYGPFIAVGIPAGGLFTGAEGVKTAAEAAMYGGTAGQQYDPCYHLACDTLDNVSLEVLDQNADAVAYATLTFAMNTSMINGERAKGNFRPVPAGHAHGAIE